MCNERSWSILQLSLVDVKPETPQVVLEDSAPSAEVLVLQVQFKLCNQKDQIRKKKTEKIELYKTFELQ